MQRYFTKQMLNNFIILSEEDSYHITKVMRMKINDEVEVVYNQKVFVSKIVELKPLVRVEVIYEKQDNKPLSFDITIVQSLVKEQKMDYILQKLTELGVSKIIPYAADRSVVRLDKKEDKKILRWKTIVKEASEQSKRTIIPVVENVMNLSNLVKLSDYDIKILCTVNETSQNLKKVLSNVSSGVKMLFVIGPEGGFTKTEEQEFINNGFLSTSLGNSVLRTETASIFIMSVIRYLDMEWSYEKYI